MRQLPDWRETSVTGTSNKSNSFMSSCWRERSLAALLKTSLVYSAASSRYAMSFFLMLGLRGLHFSSCHLRFGELLGLFLMAIVA